VVVLKKNITFAAKKIEIMKKYKQQTIPSISIVEHNDLRKYVRDFYTKNIQGNTVVNKHLGLTIYFGSDGKSELSGRAIYVKKAALVQCLLILMEQAEYNNFGQRKPQDAPSIFGYANFKAKVKIDGKIENVRISVIVKSNGKAYYNHEINIIK
jgi:hypothetical protein